MKRICAFLLCSIPWMAGADIYKCKDSHQKLVYQDTPCVSKSLGKVAPVPPLSQADELRAKERLDRMLEDNRYYDQKRREEARLREEELRRLDLQEAREREITAAAVQREQSTVYIPVYGPGYSYGRHRHSGRQSQGITPNNYRGNRPCVIGYVGDKSCR